MRFILVCLSILFSIQAKAQVEKLSDTTKVVVNGKQTDVEADREFIAGKLVIGKQRIKDSDTQNVGEILRREPAISMGKDGRIGLLGLAGYTQILVDGLPPQGIDIFSMDLVHVERIEIIRSATAATGPVGIAGTINIIRRKAERKTYTQLRAGSTSVGGRVGANLAWSSNQLVSDTPLSYNLNLSASHKPSLGESHYFEKRDLGSQALQSEFEGHSITSNAIQSLVLGSDFTWLINSSHKLKFTPDGGRFNSPQNSFEERRWADSSILFARERARQAMGVHSFPLTWNWQIDTDSNLVVKLNKNYSQIKNNILRLENWSNSVSHLRNHNDVKAAKNQSLNVDFITEKNSNHAINVGGKVTLNQLAREYGDLIDGLNDFSLNILGTKNTVRLNSKQLFAQDEWRIDRSLAVNFGLSVEQRLYRLNEGAVRNRVDFNMWSPSFNLSKKIKGDKKRQVRISLARSFQPPSLDQMSVHPLVNPFAPCPPNEFCGVNSIENADIAGNPNLQPERALGLNVSYTQGFGTDSDVLIEFYSRDIRNKVGRELVLETVPWANVPRYLSRPANLGEAQLLGINFEARLSFKDISKELTGAELHGSLSFARSELSDLPGPDNKIMEQTPWRAKLGGSHTMRSTPLKIGFEASLLPADWVRSNFNQRVYQSSQFTLGLNANWKISSDSRLTLNLENLLSKKNARIDEYQYGRERLSLLTGNENYSRIMVRLETKL